MRLINTTTLKLESFSNESVAPAYAVLSHTCGGDEVTFQDLESGNSAVLEKAGYAKLEATCRQAKADYFGYAWIDTCCID